MSSSSQSDSLESEIQWMAARAARKLVAERNGLQDSVTGAITSRAHVGLVRTKAELFKFEVPAQYGRKQWIEERDAEIPEKFWAAVSEQNWQVGDFSTWIDQTYQMQAFGVEFDREGIESMLAPEVTDTLPASDIDVDSDEQTPVVGTVRKGRNLAHNHPFAAAMTALKLAGLTGAQRRRLNAESVGHEMSEFYRESHEDGLVPHADSLKDFGKDVLNALKRHWEM